MTQQTFHRQLVYALILLGCLSAAVATATDLDHAEENLANAQNQYFEAIRDGKASSAEDRAKLQKAIVEPAAHEVGKAIHDKEQAFIKKYVGKVMLTGSVDKTGGGEALSKDSPVNKGKFTNGGKGRLSEAAGPAPDEVVVDGKEIKKVIEFRKGVPAGEPLKPSNAGKGVNLQQFGN